MDAPTLKLISGGEALPDGHGGSFRNQATIWMDTNGMPKLGDTSHAMRRRLVVIEFNQRVTAKDATIRPALQSPAAGLAVLDWMLAGVPMYLNEGLVIPDAVRKAGDRAMKAG